MEGTVRGRSAMCLFSKCQKNKAPLFFSSTSMWLLLVKGVSCWEKYPACIFMCESDGWPGRLRTKKSDATTMSILRGQGEYKIMHRCRGTAAWLTFLTGENAC